MSDGNLALARFRSDLHDRETAGASVAAGIVPGLRFGVVVVPLSTIVESRGIVAKE
jgi:hypothetical protein